MSYRTKIIALSTAVALLSIHAIAFTDIRGAIAQGQNRMPMLAQIVNSDDDPVPVEIQGTGEVSGNVSATQAGEWDVNSAQDGDWNVNAGQDGDWTVGLDPSANTVQVDGVSDANKEVFHAMTELSWGDSQSVVRSFTVPEGKRLVLEQISAHALTSNNVGWVSISSPPTETSGFFWTTDTITSYRLPLEESDISGRHVGSAQVTIYVDGGQEVELAASRDSSSTSGQNQVFLTLTGYLVDLPD